MIISTHYAPIITSAQIEVTDRNGRRRQLVEFYDAAGEQIGSWQVPLDVYVAAHEGLPNPWALTHLIVVARAVVHHLPVPEYVLESHPAGDVAARALIEERLHGPVPNPLCPACSPVENIEEAG